MNILQSLILGIVEGFTEFLPISSTAHLILASYILGLDQSAFVKTFEIAIQSGAILAVLVIYWRKFLDLEILKKLFVAFLPTAVIGLALYSIAKKYLLGNMNVVLWALLLGGIILIVFEKKFKKKNETKEENSEFDIKKITYKQAGLIGLAQSAAIIPGVSRSAATIIGGLLLGINRASIVEFSFLLAVPTIGAATALDLVKNYSLFTSANLGSLVIGFISAFVTALIGIKFLLSYIKNKTFVGFGVYRIVLVIVFVLATTFFTFSSPASSSERFTIPLTATSTDKVVDNLHTQGFVQNETIFNLILSVKGIENFQAGGYKISKNMSSLDIVNTLQGKPYLEWVLIKPGLRKEEIAEILTKELNWSNTDKQKFLDATKAKADYIEGVYFPDTYLIPIDEAPEDIVKRLTRRFDEQFADSLKEFNKQNIKWTTGLTLASLIQREAADASDMNLISGILWNRLEIGMPLQVDATLQYARGYTESDKGGGWWAPLSSAEKASTSLINSPYNTYKNKGLPPHPIANPSLAAIKAAANPEKTKCLYYLHDKNRKIHCSVTFDEHKANIEKYLSDKE